MVQWPPFQVYLVSCIYEIAPGKSILRKWSVRHDQQRVELLTVKRQSVSHLAGIDVSRA